MSSPIPNNVMESSPRVRTLREVPVALLASRADRSIETRSKVNLGVQHYALPRVGSRRYRSV